MDGVQRRKMKPKTVTTTADVSDVVDAAADTEAKSSSPRQQASSFVSHEPPSPSLPQHQQQQQSPMPAVTCSCDAERQLEGILFVVGDALLDVYADVSHEFLTTHHLQHGRAIVASEEHQCLREAMEANYSTEVVPGASGQNTARVVQWLLGVPRCTTVLACIGNDATGRELARQMTAAGVNVRYAVDESKPTGTCCLCFVDGVRSSVTDIGASKQLVPEHASAPGTRALMDRAVCLYIECYQLGCCFDTLHEIGQYALDNDRYVALTLSATYACYAYKDAVSEIMPYVDIVFGNRHEAKAYAAANQLPLENVGDIARHIARLPKANGRRGRMVVVTCGSEPTVVVENGVIYRYPVLPIERSEIVDTVGAGDSFAGGFLALFVTGADTPTCIAAGAYASNYILRRRCCSIDLNESPDISIDRRRRLD